MGGSAGALRFRDGKIMYWRHSGYVGEPELYETMAEYLIRSALPDRPSKCACGNDQPAELHLLGSTWSGRACRACRVITDFGGLNDDDVDDDGEWVLRDDRPGEPEWLCWDANVEPSSGGEAGPTQNYWNRLRQIIKEAVLLPLPGYEFGGYRETRRLDEEDESGTEAAYVKSAVELRQVAQRMAQMPREGVTLDLLEYADGWLQLCHEAAAVCDRMGGAERRYADFSQRYEVRTYRDQAFEWVENVCDALLGSETPPREPWDTVTERQVDRFERQDSACRRGLKEELSEITRRGAKHHQDSYLLIARLGKQHGLSFQGLDRYC